MTNTTLPERRGLLRALVVLALVGPGCDRGESGPGPAQVLMVSANVEEGAACDGEGDVVECHSSAPVIGDDGREVCLVGERRCEAGRWGACAAIEERPYPLASEIDGATGVARQPVVGSPTGCSGCDTRCRITSDVYNDGSDDLAGPPLASDGCEDVPGLGIRIGAGGTSAPTGLYAWVAHTSMNLVSKVHLVKRTVDGQYLVGLKGITNNPSRTAVDAAGNAFVAQRAFNRQGTLTKIAGSLAGCVDLNGDGDIDTSDGSNTLGWPNTSTQDECVLWQVPVGGTDGVPRALTIDLLGRVWVGLHNEQRFVVIDGETGAQLGSVGGLTSCPYGAVTDSTGKIWASSLGSTHCWTCCGAAGLQWIDGTSATPSDADVGDFYSPPMVGLLQATPYGITVDGADRIFMAELAQGGVMRFDLAGGWAVADGSGDDGAASGITYHEETDQIFVSYGWGYSNLITVHDPDTLAEVDSYNGSTMASVSRAHGLCPDFEGNIWAGAMGNSRMGILDPVTGTMTSVSLPGTTYTYSDFTGYSHAVVVATTASFFRTYAESDLGCQPFQHSFRERLFWEATIPDGASLSFFGASASSEAGLATATEVPLGSSSDERGNLPVASTMIDAGEDPELDYFRLRVVLHRGADSPVVERLSLLENCEP